eukprot:8971482-Ditylum_brightwellii.AAC.1
MKQKLVNNASLNGKNRDYFMKSFRRKGRDTHGIAPSNVNKSNKVNLTFFAFVASLNTEEETKSEDENELHHDKKCKNNNGQEQPMSTTDGVDCQGGNKVNETNKNWQQTGVYDQVKQVINKVWQQNKLKTSNSKERTSSNFQPGGIATLVTGKWTSYVCNSGKDEAGRWSFVM